jgi:uncharacterized protein YggT (Ycf19 family)
MMSHQPKIRREYLSVDGGQEIRWRKKVVRDLGAERRIAVIRVVQLIWLVFGVLDVLLLFRFALKLLKANPNNMFADLVYNLTELFLKPFLGLIASPTFEGGVDLEVAALVAVVVYSLLAWVMARLIWLIFYRPGGRIVSTIEEHDR